MSSEEDICCSVLMFSVLVHDDAVMSLVVETICVAVVVIVFFLYRGSQLDPANV